MRTQHVRRIASITTLERTKAGEVLLRKGDAKDYVYGVIHGHTVRRHADRDSGNPPALAVAYPDPENVILPVWIAAGP